MGLLFDSAEEIEFKRRCRQVHEDVPIVQDFVDEICDMASDLLGVWVRPGLVSTFGPYVCTECFDDEGNRYCALGQVRQNSVYTFSMYDVPSGLKKTSYDLYSEEFEPDRCTKLTDSGFIVVRR